VLSCSAVNCLQRPAASAEPKWDVLSLPVLVVNRCFSPVSVVPVRRAMVLLFTGAAQVLDGADFFDFRRWRALPIRADDHALPVVGGALRVPRVLHLLRYDRVPRVPVHLTRRNLLLRDHHQCQYCGARPGPRLLDLDHVVPRSRGGADSWENLVVACRPCNLRKGRSTPEEVGMKLSRRPERPRWTTSAQILLSTRLRFSEWQPFLGEA
jgi:5-methylcytosine-specific restriction endonuclease McrA